MLFHYLPFIYIVFMIMFLLIVEVMKIEMFFKAISNL